MFLQTPYQTLLMSAGLRPQWTMDDPTLDEVIDPRLLELDQKRGINPYLNEGSGGDREEWPVGVWQGTQSHANREELHTRLQPNSEPLAHYSMTGQLLNDWASSENDTPMNTGEESQRSPSPSVNSSEAQKANLLENPTFQGEFHTARGTPQAGDENPPQSLNAKGNGPLTMNHPVVEEYLQLVPHLQRIIEYLIDAQWYKESRQEPPEEGLPVGLGLKTRQSSSTPMSVFGEFFSARQPYDCLLCPQDSPKHKHKRTLERALGHSREHFNFKPIQVDQKTYTNLNTKNDQERRARNPAKLCFPCDKRITRQNWKRHAESKAHATLAAGYPKDQKIWKNSK